MRSTSIEIYHDGVASVSTGPAGSLEIRHPALIGRESLGPPESLTLWSHEQGAVLASVDMKISVPLTGHFEPLLDLGVVDRRTKWAGLIKEFSALVKGGVTSVPFLTADDAYDLWEALSAVRLHFAEWNLKGGFDARVWTSFIPTDHPDKYDYQGRGWLDVVYGFWGGGDLREYKSEEALKEARRSYLVDELGLKCLLLSGVQNLELCDHGVTLNFVSAIDDAVNLVHSWGLGCAVSGTLEAWWALRMAYNGPPRHIYRRLHIAGDKRLTADFMRTMQLTFDARVSLRPEVLAHVYGLVGEDKEAALLLMEKLKGVSYGKDWTPLSIEDVGNFCGKDFQIIRPDLGAEAIEGMT